MSAAAFIIAVWQIRKTQSAAESAAQAATEAREAVQHITSISDLSQITVQMDLLRELHRTGQWTRALDRYSSLRRLLTEARARLPKETVDIFTRAIMQLAEIEKEIYRTFDQNIDASGVDFNDILIDLQQSLDEVRLELETHLSAVSNTEANRYD